jgi:hypothetical protein
VCNRIPPPPGQRCLAMMSRQAKSWVRQLVWCRLFLSYAGVILLIILNRKIMRSFLFLSGTSIRNGFLMSNIAVRPFHSSRRFSHSLDNKNRGYEVPIVCTATFDYSAANEYAHAQYNILRYFDYSNDIASAVDHPIYDGRVLQTKYYADEREMLDENGFVIINSPIRMQTLDDWSNVNNVRESYLPELERILVYNLFPSRNILHCCFGIQCYEVRG